MPTPAISVEIQGLGKLRKITDPRLILGPTALVIRDMANLAELRAKANAPRDTGALQRSIAAQIQPLQARVGSTRNLIYFEVAEVGQAPAGKSKAHGFGTSAGALFVLARGIARRGFKGRFFMAKAKKAVERKLPTRLKHASNQIENSWRSGRIK